MKEEELIEEALKKLHLLTGEKCQERKEKQVLKKLVEIIKKKQINQLKKDLKGVIDYFTDRRVI